MALRPLDNALPIITQERPKKQSKVAVPIPKQTDLAVNDENRAPEIPPIADATVDYVSSDDLEPLPEPEISIQTLVEGLESKDWLKVCESLNNVRRFAIFHSTLLLPLLDKVMLVLVKAMKNPRSALCKTSIMASSDIFKSFGDKLLEASTSDAFDQLLFQLQLKSSQDKRFVCEEADKALKSMVESISPLPLLHKLRSLVRHNNLRVRAKVAISISHCVSKMGVEVMEEFGLGELAKMAAESLNDRLPEAREAARRTVMAIHEAVTTEKKKKKKKKKKSEDENEEKKKSEDENEEEEEDSWQIFCQSNLSALQALAMVKITSSSSSP